ncbi:MAG: phosphoglycerate dehydrogenase [Clostridia bacterium]|nr:phosphoglycerate dehydrogenase [Clostridia bacterium]
MKILVTESIAADAIQYLKDQGFEVEEYLGHKQEEIEEYIKGFDGLIVRSATKVNENLLSNADCLKVVGRAGNGIDNIDVKACTAHGVVAVNTPEANIMAAGELAVAHAFAIFRNICAANQGVHTDDFRRGNWIGNELEGKTVGIIGLGRIGSIVARKFRGIGMNVIAYDPYVPQEKFDMCNVKRCKELDDLLKESDLITIHTPKNKETYNILTKTELYKCKKGVRIVNAARGGLINEADLAEALTSGQVAAAAIDVFDVEPSYNKEPGSQNFDNPLIHCPNCTITPHLGASTQEANHNVGAKVTELVAKVLKGELVAAINMPSFSGNMAAIKPYVSLAEKLGKLYFQAESASVSKIDVTYGGKIAEQETGIVTLSLLKGVLEGMGKENVSFVNVNETVKEIGIKVVESKTAEVAKYTNLISVKFFTDDNRVLELCGTIFGQETEVLVSFFGYEMNFELAERFIAMQNKDVPGVIGKIATILGNSGINIGAMHWGRKADKSSDKAQSFVAVESDVSAKVMDELKAVPEVLKLSYIEL